VFLFNYQVEILLDISSEEKVSEHFNHTFTETVMTSQENPAAAQALETLLAGNRRYVEGSMSHLHQDKEWCQSLSKEQHPFAIILACSDSRVSPGIIFDQGLGDLFMIRVAGNIVDDVVLGSIEYAAAHLDVPLLMVMGHTNCGAVAATCAGGCPKGHIDRITSFIKPVADEVRSQDGDHVTNTVHALAKSVAHELETSKPILAELVDSGQLKVVASVYDIETGKVEILS